MNVWLNKSAVYSVFIFCFSSFLSLSQPYLGSNNQWITARNYIISGPPQYYEYNYYFVNGDSLIDGNYYKKIYRSYRNCGTLPWVPWTQAGCSVQPTLPALAALIREAGPRWYMRMGGGDSLLYRFDLQVGDTVKIGYPPGYCLVGSIIPNHNNSGLRLFKLISSTMPGPYNGGILEGVGPTCGFLEDPGYLFPFEDIRELMCYTTPASVGSCTWFKDLGFNNAGANSVQVNVYPNPASTTLTLQITGSLTGGCLRLADVLGRVIARADKIDNEQTVDVHTLQPGIYFFEISNGARHFTGKFIKE